MSIKILGGKASGFSLQTPTGDGFRPTSIMLKRKLFDWRQNWQGKHFIDLCAGSGAMGWEALSRGAESVWLNEPARLQQTFLKKNLQRWMEQYPSDGQVRISSMDFKMCIKQAIAANLMDSVLFFDPPYEQHDAYTKFCELIKEYHHEVWIESDERKGMPSKELMQLLPQVARHVVHGDHFILVIPPRVV